MLEIDPIKIKDYLMKLQSNKSYKVVIESLMMTVSKNIKDPQLKMILYTALSEEIIDWNDISLLPEISDITIKELLGRVNTRKLDKDMKIATYKKVLLEPANANKSDYMIQAYEHLRGDKNTYSSMLVSNSYLDYKLVYKLSNKSMLNGFITEDNVNMEYIKRFNSKNNQDNFKMLGSIIGEMLYDTTSKFEVTTGNGLLTLYASIIDPVNKFLLSTSVFSDNLLLNWILSASFMCLDADILIDDAFSEIYAYKEKNNIDDDKIAILAVIDDMFDKYENKALWDMNFFLPDSINKLEKYFLYRYILPKTIYDNDQAEIAKGNASYKSVITRSDMIDAIKFHDKLVVYFTKFRYRLLKTIYDFNNQSIDMYGDDKIVIPIDYDPVFTAS